MSNFDVSYDTPIQIQQVQPNGNQIMVVGTNGTLEIDGSLVIGFGTPVVPPLPTANGVYQLTIASGVATWTSA